MFVFNFIASLLVYGLTLSFLVSSDNAMAGNAPSKPLTEISIASEISDLDLARDGLKRAEAAFGAQLAMDCSSDRQMSWIAEDAVYKYALSNINVKLSVEGHSDVTAHLCALESVAPITSAQNIRYFPTLNPEIVYVQYELVAANSPEKLTRQLIIVELQGTKIGKFTQLSRSPESLKVVSSAL